MNKLIFTLVLLFSLNATSQSILGQWKTIDDQDGKEKSIVEIYKHNGKIYGKIIKIFDASKAANLCTKCEDNDYNKPVLGMNIIKAMVKKDKYFKGGTILDPRSGTTYKCRLWLSGNNPDKLQVRGYISFLYATQYWERVKQ